MLVNFSELIHREEVESLAGTFVFNNNNNNDDDDDDNDNNNIFKLHMFKDDS